MDDTVQRINDLFDRFKHPGIDSSSPEVDDVAAAILTLAYVLAQRPN